MLIVMENGMVSAPWFILCERRGRQHYAQVTGNLVFYQHSFSDDAVEKFEKMNYHVVEDPMYVLDCLKKCIKDKQVIKMMMDISRELKEF